MDYAWFLFSFEGRINRAKYWLATLIILCWMIFVLEVLAAVAPIFGIGGPLAINVIGISASIQLGGDIAQGGVPRALELAVQPCVGGGGCVVAELRLQDEQEGRPRRRVGRGEYLPRGRRCDPELAGEQLAGSRQFGRFAQGDPPAPQPLGQLRRQRNGGVVGFGIAGTIGFDQHHLAGAPIV